MTTPRFPVADYYDCCDSETLSHETPEDAVEQFLELFMTRGCDVSALIREHAPVTVTAQKRQTVTDAWLRRIAASTLEGVTEAFSDEYGDPDGGKHDFDEDVMETFEPRMVALLRDLCSHGQVWSCKQIGEVELDAETIEAMMREARPDWWDADEA